ncbi:rluD, partial [Symbiodinium sp. KB8]
ALAIFDVSSDHNPGAFAAVMSGAGDAGAWEAALALLRKMADCRLMATGVEFGSVLRGAPPALREELLFAFHAAYFGAEASWTELFGSPRKAAFGPLTGHCVQPAGRNSYPRQAGQVALLADMQGLLALSKPAGLSTDDALGLVAARRGHPLTRASRLDLPTSGLLVAAEGDEHSEQAWWLLAQFSGRLVSKEYLCLCFGDAGDIDHTFDIDAPLRIVAQRGQSRAFVDEDGLAARTLCRVVAKFHDAEDPASFVSLISAKPITGRTHQIRAHLASVGLALVGDRGYSAQGSSAAWEQALAVRHWCPSLFLHCWRVELIGLGGGRWAATAPLSEELAKALRGLR